MPADCPFSHDELFPPEQQQSEEEKQKEKISFVEGMRSYGVPVHELVMDWRLEDKFSREEIRALVDEFGPEVLAFYSELSEDDLFGVVPEPLKPCGDSRTEETPTTSRDSGASRAPLPALVSGNDIDSRDEFGRTALMLAARDGQESVVANLLELGADLRLRDADGKTAFRHAIENAHPEVARRIRDHRSSE